jgi:hypothetical protein
MGTSRAGHLRMAARGDGASRGRGAAGSTIMAELRRSVGHARAINLYHPVPGTTTAGSPVLPLFTAAETDETGGSEQADALVPSSLGGDRAA